MKTTWNNRQRNRDRKAIAVIVTSDGKAHEFVGKSIPGVCHAVEVAFKKDGKWSFSTYEVTHSDDAKFVSWYQDFSTGHTWPQPDWDSGFAWLSSQAPSLDRAEFENLIRQRWDKKAEMWDAAKAALA